MGYWHRRYGWFFRTIFADFLRSMADLVDPDMIVEKGDGGVYTYRKRS